MTGQKQPDSKSSSGSRLQHFRRTRGTVFWRLAAILVGTFVGLVVVAVFLSAWLAKERSLDLVASSIRLRMDSAAEEIELRGHLDYGREALPEGLLIDLYQRFEDPPFVYGVDFELYAVSDTGTLVTPDANGRPPEDIIQRSLEALENDSLLVYIDPGDAAREFAIAPLYDESGLQSGGLLVYPLGNTVDAELAGPREGYIRALWIFIAVAFVIAIALGSYVTWIIIRPLRSITGKVEAIGSGDYVKRLDLRSNDEFGRLALSVNRMAESVQQSVNVLTEADRMRRQMVANMGHDLRTPLAAMLGYLEEAIRYSKEGKRDLSKESLEIAATQGLRLQHLVNDLFELSLLDNVPPPIRFEPVPVGELLAEVAKLHTGLFEDAGITFVVDMQRGLAVVRGDGNRLIRLLNNLLSNARSHTPESGTVTLRGRNEGDMVCIMVADSGEGIQPDQLDLIFERHVKGKSARTRKESGSGLGLAISKAIAQAHGGSLTVESESGVGATFILRLPASEKENGPAS